MLGREDARSIEDAHKSTAERLFRRARQDEVVEQRYRQQIAKQNQLSRVSHSFS